MPLIKGVLINNISVSYTHLDVYKRQELQILRQLQITATFAQYSQDMMIQRGLLLMM